MNPNIRDFSSIKNELSQDTYIFDNKEQEFRTHPALNGNIGNLVFQALTESPLRTAIVDYSYGKRKRFCAAKFLAISIVFLQYIRKNIHDDRIAVAMPPCAMSYAINLAITLADKTPVNVNFSLGTTPLKSVLEQSGINYIFSIHTILPKLQKFSKKYNIIDIANILKTTKRHAILKLIAEICFCPTSLLLSKYNIPTTGGNNEAVILFSSGTTGTPKGIVLTHTNIIANCLQLVGAGLHVNHKSVLSCLPIFHSFGLTVNVWFALISKIKAVTITSPLDYKRGADAISHEKVHLLINTPTFARPYLSQIKPEKLKHLRCTIVGAERLPIEMSHTWEKKFGSPLLAGYGLTETSPVLALEYPGIANKRPDQKNGSTGRLLPGISVKFLGPETGHPLPLGETGILCAKGANVFNGYLNNPELTEKTLQDGWIITGDLARLSKDGYLYIEGRLARFSKIGGEMVPHIGIEEAIANALNLQHADRPKIVVLSRIDKKKGECLVILSSVSINMQEVITKMSQIGYSNLWIPREIVYVDEIPVLATGKLDLSMCKRLLLEKLADQY